MAGFVFLVAEPSIGGGFLPPRNPKIMRESSRKKYSFYLRGGGTLAFVAFWWLLAYIFNTPLLPSPLQTVEAMVFHARHGTLIMDTLATLGRVGLSFVVAMFIGAVIGILMGRSRNGDAFFDNWLVLGLNVPALVTIILCYIWLGLGEVAAVTAVAINKIPLVAVVLREGTRAIDGKLLEVGQVYRLPRRKVLLRLILPQLYPYAMSAARSGLSLIWKIVLVVEAFGRSNGIGFSLHTFFQFFDISGIFAYTLPFIAIVIGIESLVLRPLERHATRWKTDA